MPAKKAKRAPAKRQAGPKASTAAPTWNQFLDAAILRIQERLLRPVSVPAFKLFLPLLSPETLDEIVVERSAARLCGNPVCASVIAHNLENKIHISLAQRRLYDLTPLNDYCNESCLTEVLRLRKELPADPVALRPLAKELCAIFPELSEAELRELPNYPQLAGAPAPLRVTFRDEPLAVKPFPKPQASHTGVDAEKLTQSVLTAIRHKQQGTGAQAAPKEMQYGPAPATEDSDEEEDTDEDEAQWALPTFGELSPFIQAWQAVSEWWTEDTAQFLLPHGRAKAIADEGPDATTLRRRHDLREALRMAYSQLFAADLSDSLWDIVDTFDMCRPIPLLSPLALELIVVAMARETVRIDFSSPVIQHLLEKSACSADQMALLSGYLRKGPSPE